MLKTAFIGLGTMGGGMAGRILDAGFPLTVWNRNPNRASALAARGAQIAGSPAEAAQAADIVIAMVADDRASRDVWIGERGALVAAQPGTIVIESSTLSPAWIDELGSFAAGRGCELLDAPVTGSRAQAATGQLLFLAGGSADALNRARAVLASMSRDILHLGPTGSGARLKLINNFMCGVQAAALAEALALIERSGIDRDAALGVLSKGAPGSPLVNAVSVRMATPDYTVNFGLALMHKDLSYAIAEAQNWDLDLTTAATARARFDTALEAGWGEKDFSAVVEPLRR